MNYEHIKNLLCSNSSLKLIKTDNAPLIVSFLFQHFKSDNNIVLSSEELTTRLTDYLYDLKKDSDGNSIYPDSGKNYLDRWATQGFLRNYYTSNSELMFELTPATENVIEFIRDMDKKEFVGTESRLLRIFQTLKEVDYMSSDDPQKRLDELQRQKIETEEKIKEIESGNIHKYSDREIREHYNEVHKMIHKLISDLKQVEHNIREIDKSLREEHLNSSINTGKLLDDTFTRRNLLLQTDQGESFKAFWELLIHQHNQERLFSLIKSINKLSAIRDMEKIEIEKFFRFLINAGKKVNDTIHSYNEQLWKSLDDNTILERNVVLESIKEIKALFYKVKDDSPTKEDFITIEGNADIENIMERSLWSSEKSVELRDSKLEEGNADSVDTSVLHRQFFIDYDVLKSNIGEMLKFNSQVTLEQITDNYPIKKGIAEFVAYHDIASKYSESFTNYETTEVITIENKEISKWFKVLSPQVIFCR